MKRISILLLSFSLAITCFAQGNSIPKSSKVQALEELPEILPDSIKYRYPLFNGISVTVNIFDPFMEVFKWKRANYEATVTGDIHHRFFPQVTVGVGHCKEKNDDGLRFVTKASPFFKVGMLYNIQYNDTKPNNFYYVLARYGMSKSKADIENLEYTDGYWNEIHPADIQGQEYNCHWIEVGGGIKVQFIKKVYLGWEVTLRPMIAKGDCKYGKPYFVPGYGTSRFAFAFNLTYDIF